MMAAGISKNKNQFDILRKPLSDGQRIYCKPQREKSSAHNPAIFAGNTAIHALKIR